MRVDSGFDPSRVLTFRISADWAESSDYDGVVQRLNTTIDELAAVAGVQAVATAASLPGIPGESGVELELTEGRAVSDGPLVVEERVVSPEYFSTMSIPLLEGELCARPGDGTGRDAQAMVNQRFVDQYFANRSVIGLHLAAPSGPSMRITGIVGDARERGLNRNPTSGVYSCFSAPTVFPWFLVRTAGEPTNAASSIRARVRELEPLRAVYELAPLEERIGNAFSQNRLLSVLLTTFGAAALVLVCLGVYGTLSYVVNVQQREIGLRIALGALKANIVMQFLKRALTIVTLACMVGLVASLVLARSISTLLYGVRPADPAAFSAAVVTVVICAAFAALLPALRASRVEPMRALREH